jgi:hypothetical protein
MKYLNVSTILLVASPLVAFAQTGSLQELLNGVGGFFNAIVIPFLLAIAFLVFVVNAIRFFVFTSTTDDGKKNAKNLAIYGVATFVVILSFWGLVNLLVQGIGLGNGRPVSPDYIQNDAFYQAQLRDAEFCRQYPSSLDCQ